MTSDDLEQSQVSFRQLQADIYQLQRLIEIYFFFQTINETVHQT